MAVKHLLVHVESAASGPRLGLAVALARRLGARLTGLFAEADALGPSLVGRRSPEHLREAEARAREAFAAETGGAAVDAEWWSAGAAAHGELVDRIATCCRYADLAVFGQHDPERARVPPDLVEQVLLECGRPVLVVPSVGSPADVGRRVVVGWNASREAARALGDALPLLHQDAFVGVLAFQQEAAPSGGAAVPPGDVVAHLALHGIRARYQRAVQEAHGIGVADALINYGFESQADLTVAGAAAHGFPLRHAAPAVRAMLRSMATPLLLAH